MKFIDLFAGLGGFHHGLANVGGFECVFACEIDDSLKSIYENNYGLVPYDDITKVHESTIPDHDMLCAGFPCQPFSLAGSRKGTKCPKAGKLINDVIRIAKHRRPGFLLLENVPNVLTIENGAFWRYIKRSFKALGYKLIHKVISPDEIGIPQNRKRLFIIGFLDHDLLNQFKWPPYRKTESLTSALNNITKRDHIFLNEKKQQQLEHWQKLLIECKLENMPSVSITAPEFGATYPPNFSKLRIKDMQQYRGAYGVSLQSCKSWAEIMENMPSYTQKTRAVPDWVLVSLHFSRDLYKQHKRYLDKWHRKLQKVNNSWQILEWRGHRNYLNFECHLIQFRSSGIRVIKKTRAPSLISMTPTQIPIIGSQMRYLSKYEAAKLQNLHKLKALPASKANAFKALGNAVNAKIVELIGKEIKALT